MPTPKQYDTNIERQRAYRLRCKIGRDQERRAKGLPPAPAIPTMPAAPRWNALIENARALLTEARDDMQFYFDERSEKWQESEKAEELQQRIDALESAIELLENE